MIVPGMRGAGREATRILILFVARQLASRSSTNATAAAQNVPFHPTQKRYV